ncbi:hypothetical protein PSE10C_55760 [Pseudomonas amygdali pv. eriobotryae]|uniref:MoaD/ThiS family protein n=1 Tax=Pseudomonas amygdali pv. eriobotryae TaxID=129137 RepID=A0A9P3AID5_PSEA0|nr:hypothetical protein PSE10A_57190 [Pseudomonas amygdali pv. eriobotryae]GFZ74834.1 hypothetical protein PSE10C_55760 [Pseudomonas amygdali pv. eriobotryae]
MKNKITITLPERIFGCSTMVVTASSTQSAYQELIANFPKQHTDLFVRENELIVPKSYVTIFVNNEICYLLDMPLKDGDSLSLSLAIAGG